MIVIKPCPSQGSQPSPQGPHPTNSETQIQFQTRNQIQIQPQGPHPTKFESQTWKQTQIQTQKRTPFQIEPKPHILEQVPNFENKLGLF